MFESIMTWLAKLILEIIIDRASSAAKEAAERLAEDKLRREINEENIRKYNEAKDRETRARVSRDLLNGVRSP